MQSGFIDGLRELNNYTTDHIKPFLSNMADLQSGAWFNNIYITYFNDQFDLKRGDFVFVDGKLEGIRGIVREINKNFKIKVADYKKVIGMVDTNVSGQMYIVGSHFVSFNAAVLPYEKIRTWYLPPVKAEDEYETGIESFLSSTLC